MCRLFVLYTCATHWSSTYKTLAAGGGGHCDFPRRWKTLFIKFKFEFKCLFFKPHMEEYKKITVNVLHITYNITHINVYIITQSIIVFSFHIF